MPSPRACLSQGFTESWASHEPLLLPGSLFVEWEGREAGVWITEGLGHVGIFSCPWLLPSSLHFPLLLPAFSCHQARSRLLHQIMPFPSGHNSPSSEAGRLPVPVLNIILSFSLPRGRRREEGIFIYSLKSQGAHFFSFIELPLPQVFFLTDIFSPCLLSGHQQARLPAFSPLLTAFGHCHCQSDRRGGRHCHFMLG